MRNFHIFSLLRGAGFSAAAKSFGWKSRILVRFWLVSCEKVYCPLKITFTFHLWEKLASLPPLAFWGCAVALAKLLISLLLRCPCTVVLLKWSVMRRETGHGPSLSLYNHIMHFSKPSTKQQSIFSSEAPCQKPVFPLLPSGPQSPCMLQIPAISQK